MNIIKAPKKPVIAFAAKELQRYLVRMTGKTFPIATMNAKLEPSQAIFMRLKDAAGSEDPSEDVYEIRAKGTKVEITASNSRSVLFAVYRYLEELGCRWLHPGKNADLVPKLKNPFAKNFRVKESASYRHRCICIEGSCSTTHLVNMLDYAAKRGMNAYFLQFRNSYTFFQRWYGVEKPGKKNPKFSPKDAESLWDFTKKEAVKRGLELHTVGHGWTCEPFGIPGLEWSPYKKKISPKIKKYFALIGGKRELWGGIPLNTNLCYSNKSVQKIFVDAIVEYAETHQDESPLHVWLADGCNNNCECNACRKLHPSDFYVQMLNAIDERFAKLNLDTRMVFLAYVDLLWAPKKEKIKNPDRFILMFAPITRSYSEPLVGKSTSGEKAKAFKLNQLEFPRSTPANLQLLKGWERAFKGEKVDFDYHLWRSYYSDPTSMEQSKVLYKDLKNLDKLGMNGFISCQNQRVSFPTGFMMHVLGKTLWNRNVSYEKLRSEYFSDLFGKRGKVVIAYLESLCKFYQPAFLRLNESTPAQAARAVKGWREIDTCVSTFFKKHQPKLVGLPAHEKKAWQALKEHAWYIRSLSDLLIAIHTDVPMALQEKKRDAIKAGLKKKLPVLHEIHDTFMNGEYVNVLVKRLQNAF